MDFILWNGVEVGWGCKVEKVKDQKTCLHDHKADVRTFLLKSRNGGCLGIRWGVIFVIKWAFLGLKWGLEGLIRPIRGKETSRRVIF